MLVGFIYKHASIANIILTATHKQILLYNIKGKLLFDPCIFNEINS